MAEVATSASSSANSSARSVSLLVVVDPVARRLDGESVRIAKDVLSAGAAHTKVCLPDGPEEFARALRRRGSRRPAPSPTRNGRAVPFDTGDVEGVELVPFPVLSCSE
ncbi:hypothetical protein ACWDVV_40315, partial [Streptomyces tendae]